MTWFRYFLSRNSYKTVVDLRQENSSEFFHRKCKVNAFSVHFMYWPLFYWYSSFLNHWFCNKLWSIHVKDGLQALFNFLVINFPAQTSVFGQTSTFGAPTTQQSGGLFGTAQPASGGLFGGTTTQSFGQPQQQAQGFGFGEYSGIYRRFSSSFRNMKCVNYQTVTHVCIVM